MCQKTTIHFACGHDMIYADRCSSAASNSQVGCYCVTPIDHGTRHRQDPCIECFARQTNMVLAPDQPKGRDDVPKKHSNLYPDKYYSRVLYKQVLPSGNPEKDALGSKWVPERMIYDTERKQSALELNVILQASRPKAAVSTPVSATKAKGKTVKAPAAVATQAKASTKTSGKGKK